MSSNKGLLYAKEPARQHGSNAANDPSLWGQDIFKNFPILAAPNQTVRFVHVFEDISATQTRINLLFAALEPCCLAGSFAYNKPQDKGPPRYFARKKDLR